MSTTIDQLADLIFARKQQLDAQLRSDLIKLQVQFGDRLLGEAVAIADRMVERDRLSVSGAKAREREQRQHAKRAQQLFARRERS
jgi:hypothetical protein